MKVIGNTRANQVWEAVPSEVIKKPQPNDSRYDNYVGKNKEERTRIKGQNGKNQTEKLNS